LLDRLQKQGLDAEKLDGKSVAALFDLLLAEPLRWTKPFAPPNCRRNHRS
jgi:hypothetical protein